MHMVSPIYEERALQVGKTLVVADLHIGIEEEMKKQGAHIPPQTGVMEKEITRLIESTGSRELLILGDLKHNIPSLSLLEHSHIPGLVNRLEQRVDFTLVKGNHDGSIERLLPTGAVHEYVVRGSFLFTHGHSWIEIDDLDIDTVVLAHVHPAVEFVDDYGRRVREPVWLRGSFNENMECRLKAGRGLNFIVLPAFNPLIEGSPLNSLSLKKGLLGPFLSSEYIRSDSVRAYLLDGTDLGRLADLKPP